MLLKCFLGIFLDFFYTNVKLITFFIRKLRALIEFSRLAGLTPRHYGISLCLDKGDTRNTIKKDIRLIPNGRSRGSSDDLLLFSICHFHVAIIHFFFSSFISLGSAQIVKKFASVFLHIDSIKLVW